jgi:hypothetical protein
MKLFGIFKSKKIDTSVSSSHNNDKGKTHLRYNTLENLSIDLGNISKVDFVELGEDVTKRGDRFKKYVKSLVRTEFDMFNEIELVEFENGSTNVCLKAPVSNIKIENISSLVENFHKEFGEDMYGNKTFDKYDENSIKRLFWTGRYWNKSEPRISLKLMDDCLELSVTGIKK